MADYGPASDGAPHLEYGDKIVFTAAEKVFTANKTEIGFGTWKNRNEMLDAIAAEAKKNPDWDKNADQSIFDAACVVTGKILKKEV